LPSTVFIYFVPKAHFFTSILYADIVKRGEKRPGGALQIDGGPTGDGKAVARGREAVPEGNYLPRISRHGAAYSNFSWEAIIGAVIGAIIGNYTPDTITYERAE
jgi:hypothetical protein